MLLFFFFSSRRRHTRLVSDWSSDVCSSDLLPLRKGRVFTDHDDDVATKVVVVNEAFARKFFPQQDPIGQHVRDKAVRGTTTRSEEHTSELQSLTNLVCRLLLEKKKKIQKKK